MPACRHPCWVIACLYIYIYDEPALHGPVNRNHQGGKPPASSGWPVGAACNQKQIARTTACTKATACCSSLIENPEQRVHTNTQSANMPAVQPGMVDQDGDEAEPDDDAAQHSSIRLMPMTGSPLESYMSCATTCPAKNSRRAATLAFFTVVAAEMPWPLAKVAHADRTHGHAALTMSNTSRFESC